MATNLVSLVMQFLTPDTVGRIATALGFDRTKVQSGISGAVPALLAAFNGVASQPGGAQSLADAAQQQKGSLENFASVLAAGGQSSLLNRGSQLLTSLVGNQNQNALIGAITKFTGLGQGASGSLLGMLTRLSWASSVSTRVQRALSMRTASLIFSQAKRTISQPRYPLVLAAC
jgi:hypothetical protein